MTNSAIAAVAPTRKGSSIARSKATLWRGAAVTAVAAVLFPRLNAVLHEGQAFWQVDTEAAVLIPIIVALTLALFAAVGSWAWRGERNRPATVALACGVLAIAGVVAFFVSAPIVFGGLAVTLGAEGRRRSVSEGKATRALGALVLGTVAVIGGAAIWLVGI